MPVADSVPATLIVTLFLALTSTSALRISLLLPLLPDLLYNAVAYPELTERSTSLAVIFTLLLESLCIAYALLPFRGSLTLICTLSLPN